MRNARRRLLLAVLLGLVPAIPLGAYSICVTTYVGDCVDYRTCCFYDNISGEERGCWEMWHDCNQ